MDITCYQLATAVNVSGIVRMLADQLPPLVLRSLIGCSFTHQECKMPLCTLQHVFDNPFNYITTSANVAIDTGAIDALATALQVVASLAPGRTAPGLDSSTTVCTRKQRARLNQ